MAGPGLRRRRRPLGLKLGIKIIICNNLLALITGGSDQPGTSPATRDTGIKTNWDWEQFKRSTLMFIYLREF